MLARSLLNSVKRPLKFFGTEVSKAGSRGILRTLHAQPFNCRGAKSFTTTTTTPIRAHSSTTRPPRALVLCFDGTGESFDDDCTNVVRFVDALEKRRPDKQLYYYQPGIGTYLQPNSSWSATRQWIAKKLDYCFAWYLDTHIMDGYRFLMENYQEGDYICLFGFSRGAYTARCLTGMLHKVGLLPKSNGEHVAFAYEKYLDDTPWGKKAAQGFKRTFSTTVPIEFVGVWDTVASVGWTFKHLPFTDSNTIVQRFRHALALDEHRVEFMPNLFHRHSCHHHATHAQHDPETPTTITETPTEHRLIRTFRGWLALPKQSLSSIFSRRPVDHGCDDDLDHDTNDDWEYHHGQATDVQEVWFAGCHADVGGGSTPNHEVHTLANPSLQWMISEVIKHAPYVLFKPDAFASNKAFSTLTVTETDGDPKPARPRTSSASRRATAGNSSIPSNPTPLSLMNTADGHTTLHEADVEEEQRVHSVVQTEPETDANAKIHDQLLKAPMWHILEYIPTIQHYQDENGDWQTRFRCNALGPREIHESAPKFHKSVKLRKDYKWKTKFITKPDQEVNIEYVE